MAKPTAVLYSAVSGVTANAVLVSGGFNQQHPGTRKTHHDGKHDRGRYPVQATALPGHQRGPADQGQQRNHDAGDEASEQPGYPQLSSSTIRRPVEPQQQPADKQADQQQLQTERCRGLFRDEDPYSHHQRHDEQDQVSSRPRGQRRDRQDALDVD